MAQAVYAEFAGANDASVGTTFQTTSPLAQLQAARRAMEQLAAGADEFDEETPASGEGARALVAPHPPFSYDDAVQTPAGPSIRLKPEQQEIHALDRDDRRTLFGFFLEWMNGEKNTLAHVKRSYKVPAGRHGPDSGLPTLPEGLEHLQVGFCTEAYERSFKKAVYNNNCKKAKGYWVDRNCEERTKGRPSAERYIRLCVEKVDYPV